MRHPARPRERRESQSVSVARRKMRESYSLLLDVEVVRHREDAMYSIRSKAHEFLICLIGNDAFESHVAVLHNNADWFEHRHCVPIQRGVLVNRPVEQVAQPVIVGGQRQYFDLVVHLSDSTYTLYGFLSVCL
jgi:hypothetical protein